MPDQPSFEYLLYEHIEEKGKRLILHVRRLYYTGRGEQKPHAEQDLEEPLTPTDAAPLYDKEKRIEYCRRFNDENWIKVSSKLAEIRSLSPELPTLHMERLKEHFENTFTRYLKWYWGNNQPRPRDVDKLLRYLGALGSEARMNTHPPAKPLRLTPNEKEKLRNDIYAAVKDYQDKGKGSQQQAFEYVASKSKKLLGIELTKDQVEGRYKRSPEYKEEKRRKRGTPVSIPR